MLSVLMFCLVATVGGASTAFAWRYLAGSPARPTYMRWFAATIAAATTVVLSTDIVLMAAAWTVTSLTLHRLLSIDGTRVAAQMAAHKKFLLSRVADAAIWTAVLLLVRAFGTASREEILAQVSTLASLPSTVHVAMVALAFGVILRSAQLPFHGWLVGVMDVPTPVSALLHAGIVNLGAYVLVSLAPLGARVPVAQSLLLLSGTLTATLAVLVMRTRANAKGALAWSTVAQMGFVLVECGLGAYDLALLHIIAHGLYKSHAFLRSGRVVRRATSQTPVAVPAARVLAATIAALVLTAAGIALFWPSAPASAASWFAVALIASSLVSVFASTRSAGGRTMLGLAATGLALPALYALWQHVLSGVVPAAAPAALPVGAAWAVVAAFVLLTAISLAVAMYPTSQLATRLFNHASCGFHLDDVFTRLTFLLWPPARLPQREVFRGESMVTAIRRAA